MIDEKVLYIQEVLLIYSSYSPYKNGQVFFYILYAQLLAKERTEEEYLSLKYVLEYCHLIALTSIIYNCI